MTICVAVKAHDSLVFAADSATSLTSLDAEGNAVISNVFNHGHKVFSLYRHLPICAMTSGIGNFGAVSISTLAKDLRALLSTPGSRFCIDPESYSMEGVAQHAYAFLFQEKFEALDPKPMGGFTFWIGGYSSGSDHSEVWKIEIIDGKCDGPKIFANSEECRIGWSGQTEFISRVVLGFDQTINPALIDAGVDPAVIDGVTAHLSRHTQANIINAAMPARDVIDLASFLVDGTKSFVRFLPGANTVGGDTDIATVTKHEGFKWIKRKHYYNADLNPLETDHV